MRYALLAGFLPLLWLFAVEPAREPGKTVPQAGVPRVKELVQPILDRDAKEAQAQTLEELRGAAQRPALYKVPVVSKGLAVPWDGLVELENHGLRTGEAARGGTFVS